MSSKIRTKMVSVLTVSVGAIALCAAAAQADDWTSGGLPLTSDIGVALAGQIEMNAGGGALFLTCDVSGRATLLASGATGTINTFAIDAASCTTNLPGCAVSTASTSAPWGIAGSSAGGSISITGVSFAYTLVGSGCGALAGPKAVVASAPLVAGLNGSIVTLSAASGGLQMLPGGWPVILAGDVGLSGDIGVV